jgi:hypothetical protein
MSSTVFCVEEAVDCTLLRVLGQVAALEAGRVAESEDRVVEVATAEEAVGRRLGRWSQAHQAYRAARPECR